MRSLGTALSTTQCVAPYARSVLSTGQCVACDLSIAPSHHISLPYAPRVRYKHRKYDPRHRCLPYAPRVWYHRRIA
eukprot:2227073-Rhodomonas_salina.2